MYTKKPVTLRKLTRLPEDARGYRARGLWEAVEHKDLLSEIDKTCKQRGLAMAKPIIHTDKSGLDMVAFYRIEGHDEKEYGYALSVVNTNTLKYPLSLYGGVYTLGQQSGVSIPLAEYRLGKHTRGMVARMQERVEKAVDSLAADLGYYARTVASLKMTTFAASDIDQLLRCAGTAKLMPWSRIGRIYHLLGTGETQSAWDLLRCFAEIARMNPPIKQIHQVNRFREIMMGERTLPVPAKGEHN